MGICNGFQILVESGLLPGALIINNTVKFISKDVALNVQTNKSIFTSCIDKGKKLVMPIAHKEGNYIANQDIISQLEDQDRILFRYDNNPNGSINDIAGIINEKGNVLGMMPHPERASEKLLGSDDGSFIFKSILSSYV